MSQITRQQTDARQREAGLARSWTSVGPTKVPEIMAGFWVAKALSTALGESTSDFLVHRIGPPAPS